MGTLLAAEGAAGVPAAVAPAACPEVVGGLANMLVSAASRRGSWTGGGNCKVGAGGDASWKK